MSHVHHQALEGFDARQILHDGCPECEERGENVANALAHMDNANFERAWKRAYDLYSSSGESHKIGQISYAETDLLGALWGIQVALERRGMKLDGTAPRFARALTAV